MKVDIKAGGIKYSVDFRVMPANRETHLSAIAKSSKDLDELQTAILNRGAGDDMIGVIVAKALENKLKLPIEVDHSYSGAGYGFKFDLYSIANKLK
jgi:hypothetical protein